MHYILSAVLLLTTLLGYTQDNKYLPKGGASDQILVQKGYVTGYDLELKLPEWVAYELTGSELIKVTKRDNLFRLHPEVPADRQNSTDSYKGSGYDRGHMAPSADLCWSTTAMVESFYMTNMTPQLAAFNRGIWKETEELTRKWAEEYGAVYVISGCVFKPYTLSMPTGSGVEIPKQFFKIILREEKQGLRAIAFLFENKKLSGEPRKYVTNVDEIEQLTGLDFFSELEDTIEEVIEAKSQPSYWNFSNQPTSQKVKKSNQNQLEGKVKKEINDGQCNGITKAGNRCKRKVSGGKKYCYQHE